MNPQLKHAINAYIVNEFKIEPKLLEPDFDLIEDLGLNQNQLDQFLERLQEALSVTIPEEKLPLIHCLEDLYLSFSSDDETYP